MTDKTTRRLQRTRSRIDPDHELFDEDIPEDELPLLEEFDEALDADGAKGAVSHMQHLTYAVAFTKCRDDHGITLEELLTGGDDALDVKDRFETWVNTRRIDDGDGGTKKMSQKTRAHYRNFARQFGELVADCQGKPDHLEAITATVEREDDWNPTPHPNTVLYWDEHVTPILDHPTIHIRDKALCAVLWDSGGRESETHRMTIGDVEDKGDHIRLTIWNGKTGSRHRRLICSMPYLRKWLRKHPVNEELDEDETAIEDAPDDTPLWTSQWENEKYDASLRAITSVVGDRAGVSRPTNPKQFRKSRASILAADPLVTEEALRMSFGWKPNSNAPQHYKAQFGKEADEQIAAADGMDIEFTDDHEDPAPVECPRCEQWTPRHCDCIWCRATFDVEKAEENTSAQLDTDLRQMKRELLGLVAKGEITPEDLDVTLPFAEVMHNDSDVVDQAEAFLEARDG